MPKLVTEILRTAEHMASQGSTVLLVEQNLFEALQVCKGLTSCRPGVL